MRMPVDDLPSNWAYMVMSALAWNLKSWYGLLMPNRQGGLGSVRMEFRRFLHAIVSLPTQIVRSARRIYLPDHGLQSLVKRLLCHLGISAPDGACLMLLFWLRSQGGTGTL